MIIDHLCRCSHTRDDHSGTHSTCLKCACPHYVERREDDGSGELNTPAEHQSGFWGMC